MLGLSCKEAVKHLNFKENLTFFKKAHLWFHVIFCHYCSCYAKHLKIIKEKLKKDYILKIKITEKEIGTIIHNVLDKFNN